MLTVQCRKSVSDLRIKLELIYGSFFSRKEVGRLRAINRKQAFCVNAATCDSEDLVDYICKGISYLVEFSDLPGDYPLEVLWRFR